MAFNDPSIHYVKFQRGTTAAYNRLKENNRLDNDTLYFIYTSQDATRGLLYLGDKLISGSVDDGGSIISDISIADMADVVIDDNSLSSYLLLVYDASEEAWVNTDLSDIIHTAVSVMEGATDLQNGKSGLVPTPKAGDLNKFLRGDGNWAEISVEAVTPNFSSSQFEEANNGDIIIKGSQSASLNQLVASDGDGGIKFIDIPTGNLSRTIVESTAEIDLTDPNKIFMVRKSAGSATANDRFDEYMVIDGQAELLGSISSDINLSNYATITFVNNKVKTLSDILNDTETVNGQGQTVITPGLITKVDNILIDKAKIGDLSYFDTNYTLVDAIDDISERLAWFEIN